MCIIFSQGEFPTVSVIAKFYHVFMAFKMLLTYEFTPLNIYEMSILEQKLYLTKRAHSLRNKNKQQK